MLKIKVKAFLIRKKEYIIVVPGWVVKMLLSNSTEWKLSIRPIGTRVKSKGAPVTNWQNIITIAIFTRKSFIFGFKQCSELCREGEWTSYRVFHNYGPKITAY